MLRKHLTRLSVMVITCSITIAMFAEVASAGMRGLHLAPRHSSTADGRLTRRPFCLR